MRPWHYAVILVVVVGLVFSEVRNMDFVDWDDNVNVYANPRLNPPTAESLVEIWTEPYFALYIPVTHTVWAGVAALARQAPDARGITLNATHFHVANLIVHALNVLLVFAILRLLLRRDWAAFVGAGLFALHPVQVEPVAWVTGMKDLMGSFLALAALWQYLVGAAMMCGPSARLSRSGATAPAVGRPELHMGLGLVLFALALLAKPTVVGLVLIAWALDHLVIGRDAGAAARSLILWVPVAIAGAVLAKVFTGTEPDAVPLWGRPFVAGDALAFYLGKLVWPVGLCTDYHRTPHLVLASWWGYVTWLAPAAVAAALVALRRRRPALVAAGIVLGVALLPVLGLVPFPDEDVTDRYLYLAMLGPALAVGWLVVWAQSTRVNALALLVLASLGFASSFQALHWSNTASLFTHVLEVNPRSYVAHTTMANERLNHRRLREAYAHANQALALQPDYAPALDALGRVLMVMGEPEEAADAYRRSVAAAPDSAMTHFSLGNALVALGELEGARAEYEEAVRLDPAAWYAHENLAAALLQLGETERAVEHLRECVRLRPEHEAARQELAATLRLLGRDEEAERVIEETPGR